MYILKFKKIYILFKDFIMFVSGLYLYFVFKYMEDDMVNLYDCIYKM